jgi:hypothetical protein
LFLRYYKYMSHEAVKNVKFKAANSGIARSEFLTLADKIPSFIQY